MMNSLTIRNRLLIGFILLALLAGGIGGCGMFIIEEMSVSATTMYEKITVPLAQMAMISVSFQRSRVNLRDAVAVHDPQERATFVRTIDELEQTISAQAVEFEKTIISEEGRRLFAEFKQARSRYEPLAQRVLQLDAAGKDHEAVALMEGEAKAAALLEQDLLNKLMESKREQAALTARFDHAEARKGRIGMTGMAVVAVLLAMILGLLTTAAIIRPLDRAVGIAGELSRGNLTVQVDVDRGDEIGTLLQSMAVMTASLKSMFTDISHGVTDLTASSSELAAISQQLTSSAHNSADKSSAIAAASEQMNSNFQSVSAAMEESASNVNMIASSIEEMAATVSEVAESAEKARLISDEAVVRSRSTSERMANLGESAHKIGRVTEAITEISEQTNLLALNATIEAARAGEAGKGFAVVANEIKELARQTAEATVDIRNQISEMQGTTAATIEDIAKISQVIAEINAVIGGIATAVEEQTAVAKEIAGSITQASQGIAEVNESVAHSTLTVTEITGDIKDISGQSTQVVAGSNQVQGRARGLSELADKLMAMVGKFKL